MCTEKAIDYPICGHRDVEVEQCDAAKRVGRDHRRGRGLRQAVPIENEGKCAECVEEPNRRQQNRLTEESQSESAEMSTQQRLPTPQLDDHSQEVQEGHEDLSEKP